MIYILGVNEHRYQAVNPKTNPDEAKFYDYLLKHVQGKKISHIAEEMNDEALQRETQAQESVCRRLANDLGLTHTMCDPNTMERREIGYIDKPWEQFVFEDDTGSNEKINKAHFMFHKKQWHIREEFWFQKLQPHLSKNVLFIYGAQHVNRFSNLLKRKGVKSQVICKRWKP